LSILLRVLWLLNLGRRSESIVVLLVEKLSFAVEVEADYWRRNYWPYKLGFDCVVDSWDDFVDFDGFDKAVDGMCCSRYKAAGAE